MFIGVNRYTEACGKLLVQYKVSLLRKYLHIDEFFLGILLCPIIEGSLNTFCVNFSVTSSPFRPNFPSLIFVHDYGATFPFSCTIEFLCDEILTYSLSFIFYVNLLYTLKG